MRPPADGWVWRFSWILFSYATLQEPVNTRMDNLLIELLTRVLCDTAPPTADFCFIFGQTADNQASVLQKAEQLLAQNKVKKVGFVQTQAMSGYPGFAAWQDTLAGKGVRLGQMEGVSVENPALLHTLIEAQAMARHVREKGYCTVCVLAAPFHQLRAFMTAVTAATAHNVTAQLFSVPGVALPWQEQVAHSQGNTMGTRQELIAGELERIEKYIQKGDLATVETVLKYLDKR